MGDPFGHPLKYRDELARMAGERVAKKEMVRRMGLSVTTVKKYLKTIEEVG